MVINLIAIFLLPSILAIGSVPESEIPSQYTEEQLSALNDIFNEISTLTAGAAQMSAAEFDELNLSISSYTENQREVLNLLLADTWSLIEGIEQLSDSEFLELKEKYYLTESSSPPDDSDTQDTQQDQEDSQPDQQDQDDTDSTSDSNTDSSSTSSSTSSLPPSTSQPPETSSQTNQKITLNPKSQEESVFVTQEGTIRTWFAYIFSAVCLFIIILLALRKL